ncbi:MAG TPA: response regulator [Thermoanaerobaculia bacterium]|jgi:DNA-binding response OmpR family regulator|nr:response regulator [Thermoanaerobaculia bacterium]
MSTTEPGLPILIVDDDEPTQNLLRVVLRRHAYETDVAANGRDAIGLLQAKPFAAVVLDMMMPEVGGHEVIAFLGAREHHVPVIICTAAGPAVLTGVDPAVVKAIIRKPFDIDELVAAVIAVTAPKS